jgi:hypothetical protein
VIFNINEFRSITSGFQKPNKFKVTFPIPAGLVGAPTAIDGQPAIDTVRYFEFYTNSVDLPGISWLARPINRYGFGANEKKPSSPIYSDCLMTFYNDTPNDNLQFFHAWMQLIGGFALAGGVTQGNPWEMAYKDEYAVDPIVHLYDIAGNEQYSVTIRQCYPLNIPNIRLSWQNEQTIMMTSVLFTYFDWFPNNNPNQNNAGAFLK